MKTERSSFNLLGYSVVLSCLFISSLQGKAFAGALDELSQADQIRVKNGEQVAVFQDVDGKPWPKVKIYQKVHATAQEVAAVFVNFEKHFEYFPHLTKSKVVGELDKRTKEIDYTMRVAGLITENYTIRNHLSTYNSSGGSRGDDSYRVDWKLVKAESTQYSEGSAQFEKLDDGALVAYYSFIIPPDRFTSSLGWVVEGAKTAVKDAVTALKDRVEKEKAQQPAYLQLEISQLEKALTN